MDSTHPKTVVGTGAPETCTFPALEAAVAAGGIVTFNCGPDPVTIFVQRSLAPPMSNAYVKPPQEPIHTVVDGGGLVTLTGGGAVRIFNFCHGCDAGMHGGSFRVNADTLTLQHLRLIDGKATNTTPPFPYCPPNATANISNLECSTGYSDGAGGAVLVRDGSLRVIDCYLAGNEGVLIGPDVGGGAIYITGSNYSVIAQSTFVNNRASNAGAIGCGCSCSCFMAGLRSFPVACLYLCTVVCSPGFCRRADQSTTVCSTATLQLASEPTAIMPSNARATRMVSIKQVLVGTCVRASCR